MSVCLRLGERGGGGVVSQGLWPLGCFSYKNDERTWRSESMAVSK